MTQPSTSASSLAVDHQGQCINSANDSIKLSPQGSIEDTIEIGKPRVSGEGEDDNDDNGDHPDTPPAKRRKLAEVTNGTDSRSHSHKRSTSRAISPPWKSVKAEGPTSFLDNGKRRSGRTNAVPLELQPDTGKRRTRAALDKAAVEKSAKVVYSDNKKARPETPKQPPKHIKTPSVDITPAGKSTARPTSSTTIKKEPASKKTVIVKSPPQKQKVSSSPKRKNARVPTRSLPTSKGELLKEIQKLGRQFAKEGVEFDSAVLDTESEASDDSDDSIDISNVKLWIKSVKFKPVRLVIPTPSAPSQIPKPPRYNNIQDFLLHDTSEELLPRPRLSTWQIQREATKRLAVVRATDENGLIKTGLPKRQVEPAKEFAHRDHLLAHAEYFHELMTKEKAAHRRLAAVLANEARRYLEAKRFKGRVKSPAELEAEARALWLTRHKTVVKDIARLWQAVEGEVNAARLRRYEQEQQEKIKGHLNRVLDRHDAMLKREDTDMGTSDVDSESANDEESDTDTDASASDSEQMSASDSHSESSEGVADGDDAEMTVEELKAKYENIPALQPALMTPPPEMDIDDTNDADEDSDPETIMDSEMDSDSDENEVEDDDDATDDGSGDEHGGLLSLFSKKEIQDMEDVPAQESTPDPNVIDDDSQMDTGTAENVEAMADKDIVMLDDNDKPLTEANGDEQKVVDATTVVKFQKTPDTDQHGMIQTPEATSIEASSTVDPSDHPSPRTSVTKLTAVEPDSTIQQDQATSRSKTPDSAKTNNLTPVSPLLRGTLREYQHEGLDWLAKLYANGRSGILADEMGLGKTIQSISLLAHLATTYEVWGPHLIVVPTSVMLNWEMEFKKFLPGFKILTYYGDIQERKQKRRGWLSDDNFNVVITSYQLVLKDASAFKRRKWHYMILDEAHNIKNFRSERWQTMMTFNTRARLLLTGTPLQNNLTELWSLLFFLHYGQETEGEDDAFAGLREWSEWFKRPVESILEQGKQVLDQEDQEQVSKLHKVIRPFLLRRLKRDVEKQMPAKFEHVEFCRLSKRQRQLYDGFMSRAQTRETLASGNYLSIINALMQLRKVCNHPDLFETRPINTSFAMPKAVAAEFEIKDLLVRRKLLGSDPFEKTDLDFLELIPISREDMSKRESLTVARYNAYKPFRELRERQWLRTKNRSKMFTATNRLEVLQSLESVARRDRLQEIDRTMYYDAYKHHQHPVYGSDLLKYIDLPLKDRQLNDSGSPMQWPQSRSWEHQPVVRSLRLVKSVQSRSQEMQSFVEQYACITPAAVALDLPVTVIGESRIDAIRQQQALQKHDPFHHARMKLSIAFPDKRLLQYDCGKLQRLDKLLRRLQSGGHRALIFTQMTKVLDILEQFLNIHGHRYLRLDGSTNVEQRQSLTERFNKDDRILCFILSSRSGGIGINLTGADTVIFYDLDWNPAMDRQCTDRAHRIGQTRDVHIYRFVSEHTIETNILRKANQKQLLDDVVIQNGDFTTDYMNKLNYKDMLADGATDDDVAGAAMDRVLGNTDKAAGKAFEEAEDRDDVAAARVAEKEVENIDDEDFSEQPKCGDPAAAPNAAIEEVAQEGVQHIDEYLIRVQKWLLQDVPLVIKSRDKSRRGKARKRDLNRRR